MDIVELVGNRISSNNEIYIINLFNSIKNYIKGNSDYAFDDEIDLVNYFYEYKHLMPYKDRYISISIDIKQKFDIPKNMFV